MRLKKRSNIAAVFHGIRAKRPRTSVSSIHPLLSLSNAPMNRAARLLVSKGDEVDISGDCVAAAVICPDTTNATKTVQAKVDTSEIPWPELHDGLGLLGGRGSKGERKEPW